jgi:asparagine synthase (glutamine-hydrolysing)
MLASIEYRGPDGSGEYRNDHVHMGAVRLAIIDLKGGQQPVHGCDERVTAIYNGEIYNHHEVRSHLRGDGHHLQDECDTTILPHLYEREGDALVESLRGMYAFAIWDDRERRLLLARDRFGIKPLYYAVTPDYLVFGSEIKAILASGLVEARLAPDSIDDLFSLSYPCPPRTMFRDIYELRPAHLASVAAGRSFESPRRYWRTPFPQAGEHRRGSAADLAAEVRATLERKVYDHLQADVRVATYLSGGLDSAAITSVVKHVTGDAPETFTIGFSSEEHDEQGFAKEMARDLGSANHLVRCGPDSAQLFPEMIWHTELPLQFPLALPLMQLSALARAKGFPVVLTGEGADEMLGGYDCFRGQKMRRLLDRPGIRRLSPILYRQLYKWLGAPEGMVDRMLANHAATSLDEVKARYGGVVPAWREVWLALDIDRDLLLASDGRKVRPLDEPPAGFFGLVPEEVAGMHPLDAQLALEMESRLPSWMLLIGDRASMSRGVEARVPFLDHELVELIASMPPSLKMKGFTEKAVLREAVKGLVPDAIRRRQKRPFYTPLQEWFFHPGAPEYVEELLGETAIRRAGIFAPEVVKQLRQQLATAPRHHLVRMQLEWMLVLVLGTQLLQHLFVENFDPASQGVLRPDRSDAWEI